jgi:hypothetical protein
MQLKAYERSFYMNENMATLSPWIIMIDRFMEMMVNFHGETGFNSCFYGNFGAESL